MSIDSIKHFISLRLEYKQLPMKKTTLFVAAILTSAASIAQIAGTSFEEPGTFSGRYTDTGNPAVAHPLVNNPDEPLVNYVSAGGELGFKAYYEPYDTPDVGLTDGDFVGVMSFTPTAELGYTDGDQGYQMNDIDGNMILEFDEVDLTGVSNPSISLDFLLSINTNNPANGNYEGDGSENTSENDRLRIYVKDLTNNTVISLFDSTGTDLDEFVPFDNNEGVYILQWQNATAQLLPDTQVQLVIEGRSNASAESFWFDNIIFEGTMGINDQASDAFSVYPNPATDGFVNISSKFNGAKKVSVFDVLGKEVIRTTMNGERLNISTLNSGVYILKVEQGRTTTTKKLVVN